MSTRIQIPLTAECIATESLLIPVGFGPYGGRNVKFSVFEGYASKGYKSDFERVPHRWFTCKIDGERTHIWSYSGGRIDRAMEHYTKNIAELKAEIAKQKN